MLCIRIRYQQIVEKSALIVEIIRLRVRKENVSIVNPKKVIAEVLIEKELFFILKL